MWIVFVLDGAAKATCSSCLASRCPPPLILCLSASKQSSSNVVIPCTSHNHTDVFSSLLSQATVKGGGSWASVALGWETRSLCLGPGVAERTDWGRAPVFQSVCHLFFASRGPATTAAGISFHGSGPSVIWAKPGWESA